MEDEDKNSGKDRSCKLAQAKQFETRKLNVKKQIINEYY